MKTRGVIYDPGTVYGTGLISVSTRLAFDRTTTRRELEMIGTDPSDPGCDMAVPVRVKR
ncbi:MAG TPA: hypothetical protein VMA73_34640 [Streptosporangiaceae bacterium]|nr:hypothetical protein [Streptosporangiaceae bacterium]